MIFSGLILLPCEQEPALQLSVPDIHLTNQLTSSTATSASSVVLQQSSHFPLIHLHVMP